MTVGKTQELTVSAQPSDATKSVTWKSDNAAVASVSNGTVTANGEGVAHITATSTVASSVTATATVTVTKPAAGETASLTITLESFDLVDNYNFQNWSSGGVEGIAYIFGGSATYPAENGMQFKTGAESCYLANTTAIPGKITSITAKSFKYANNWTVLTSDASFGRVTGKPTGGTNQGQKQVPTTGATWEIGGDDSFFAITYDTTEYSGYLDSITVEYIVSQDAPHQHVFEYEILDENSHTVTCESCEVHETEPHEYSDASDTTCNKCGFERTVHNEEALEVFHAAVTAIQTEGTLSERFACIKRAIEAYRALTQDQLALAEEDIGLLEAAIEAYNESIQAYNADAAAANKGALGALLNG